MNRTLVLAEWRRAVQSLAAADMLSKERFHEDAVSRAYYAILHAAKAALYVHDISAESHTAVNRLFGLHLIRPGDIERAWSSYLIEGLDDRLAADYDTEVSFSADETAGEYHRAGEFVERVRRYLITKGFSIQEL